MILQSLVKSADKNSDRAMDWQEFEGFGDFELVFKRWPQMWQILQDDLLAGMNACGRDGNCFPSPWTTEDLMRCQTYCYILTCKVFSGTSPSTRWSSDWSTTCSTTRIYSSAFKQFYKSKTNWYCMPTQGWNDLCLCKVFAKILCIWRWYWRRRTFTWH